MCERLAISPATQAPWPATMPFFSVMSINFARLNCTIAPEVEQLLREVPYSCQTFPRPSPVCKGRPKISATLYPGSGCVDAHFGNSSLSCSRVSRHSERLFPLGTDAEVWYSWSGTFCG